VTHWQLLPHWKVAVTCYHRHIQSCAYERMLSNCYVYCVQRYLLTVFDKVHCFIAASCQGWAIQWAFPVFCSLRQSRIVIFSTSVRACVNNFHVRFDWWWRKAWISFRTINVLLSHRRVRVLYIDRWMLFTTFCTVNLLGWMWLSCFKFGVGLLSWPLPWFVSPCPDTITVCSHLLLPRLPSWVTSPSGRL